MLTIPVLTNVQIERMLALPAKFSLPPPLSTPCKVAVQCWTLSFYDVGTVATDETPGLAFWLAREGAVIFVPPTGGGRLKVFLALDDYLRHALPVATLAIAGVGSSALGAAAFARNGADGQGEPVAAVVSGCGLADVLTYPSNDCSGIPSTTSGYRVRLQNTGASRPQLYYSWLSGLSGGRASRRMQTGQKLDEGLGARCR